MNKKIRNATVTFFDDIRFKSILEKKVYEKLKESGFQPNYEAQTFLLVEGFKPTVPFWVYNKKQNCFKNNSSKLRDWSYTPDFIIDYNGYKIFIEVKGFQNDIFPYKFKLFRKLLEKASDKDHYIVVKINSVKEASEFIEYLKQSL